MTLSRGEGATVAEWGERRLVQAIRDVLGVVPPSQIGVGDDAAVFDIPDGCQVVLSTDRVPSDLLSRRLGLMSNSDLGRYLVEVNVSDIVAMGATPCAVVLNLGFASDIAVDEVLDLVAGAAARGEALRAPVLGGDTKMTSVDSFVATAVGWVAKGRALRRGTASAGDQVFVTGTVGGFGAALSYFRRNPSGQRLPAAVESRLLARLIRPTARTDLVSSLEMISCSACMDITDGLGESLREMERAGDCAFDIDLDAIPVDPAVHVVADLLALDWRDIIFGIGLDLELLGCTSTRLLTPPFTRIGTARSRGSGPSRVRHPDGRWAAVPGRGFQHFAGDPSEFVT